MTQFERNIQTLRRCQLYHDNMESPEYYDDDESGWRRDEDGDLYYYEKEDAA